MKNAIISTFTIEELSNLLFEKLKTFHEIKASKKETEKKHKEFLTREETAKLCKVKSLTTLWNWKKKGKLIPKGKAGSKPLYLRQDVIDFVQSKNKSA